MRAYYVYILASGKNGTLYIGVTNDLFRRIQEHKQGLVEGFSKKYKVDQLVYYEETEDIVTAIEYEKRLKSWNRDWKVQLIERINPQWNDLFEDIIVQ
jgi:putative endonuclease